MTSGVFFSGEEILLAVLVCLKRVRSAGQRMFGLIFLVLKVHGCIYKSFSVWCVHDEHYLVHVNVSSTQVLIHCP